MLDHKSRDAWSLEWLIERGLIHGFICGVVGYIWGIFILGVIGGVLLFPPGFAVGLLVWRLVSGFAGRGTAVLYTPSGDSTAYAPTFSHIDAMIIRGQFDAAADAFDVAMLENPQNAGVIVKAADFHMRERKDPPAALQLYLRARQLGSGGQDLQRYVQQKIVDLYLGPLAAEGKAMGELRRLIDQYPDTREAEAAREALAELKRVRDAGDV